MSSLVVGKSWLTLEELSQYLCFSKEKIYLLLKARQIPAVKVGRHWRFNRQQVDEWLISLTPSVEPPDIAEKPQYSASLEIVRPAGEIKVVLQKEVVDPKLQNDLWETYHDTFERNKEKAAQDQRSYDRSTFIDALTDPDYLKFVLVKDDSIKGLSLATNNL
ncbi:MAG: helix-turn-helix domain-containing protein, partial [Candidatus Margulisiibacteriota bacterium]